MLRHLVAVKVVSFLHLTLNLNMIIKQQDPAMCLTLRLDQMISLLFNS